MSVTASWSGGGSGWSVLVHGGAGRVPEGRRASHAEGCLLAARAAAALLGQGASALDAAQRAVEALEDDARFNAGTGACLAIDGHLQLDAAIMEGAGLRAGAICALPAFKNPIAIARAVLDDGAHVFYADDGAREFAESKGFSLADEASMITEAARKNLEKIRATGKAQSWAGDTVGAVVRDSSGTLASATSTGGTAGKRRGRVGDAPVFGAGTYADDSAGAVSATGEGEGILRVALGARCIEALRGGAAPDHAASDVIATLHERTGAKGGIIVVAPDGRLGFARSTVTMSWAAVAEGADESSGA